MNRLFFRPEQSGLSKVEASLQTCGILSPMRAKSGLEFLPLEGSDVEKAIDLMMQRKMSRISSNHWLDYAKIL